jgi:diguanylate cyclase (GGDEF)-like protein
VGLCAYDPDDPTPVCRTGDPPGGSVHVVPNDVTLPKRLDRSHGASRALLLAGAAVMAVYVLMPRGGLAQAVVFLGWMTVAAGLLIVRVCRDRSLPRLWRALAAGLGMYVVATYPWYLLPVALGRTLTFPSMLDALYFLSYGLFGAFLLAVIGRRRSGDDGERRLAVVDAAIFTNALLVLLWEWVIAPNIAGAEGAVAAKVAAVAYPAFTALLFGLAVRIVLGGIAARAADLLLVGWIGGELFSDIFYGYTSLDGTISYGHPVFLGWLAAYTAVAALAVHPRLAEVSVVASQPPLSGGRSRLGLLLAAALLPIALAMTRETGNVLLATAAAGFTLVIIRMSMVSGDLEEQRRLADELAQMSEELRHRALHDPLTGLGNRALVMEALEHAVRRRAAEPGTSAALLLLDLDNFKTVNDSFGHEAGDGVLVEVAARLMRSVRSADTVARLGGDEFAVILEDVSAEDALRSARRIIEVIREPVRFDGRALPIRASVGLHLAEEGTDVRIAVRNADLAMYAAKALGGDRYELYQAGPHHAFLVRHELEMQLREAAVGEQLHVYYQPIIDLATNATVGVEALLRWQHPERGLLLPWEFMDVAESSSVIVGIGRRVLEEACRQYVRWQADFHLPAGFRVAVNVSRRQLMDPHIVDHVARILADTGCDAHALVFEVTETAVMANVADLSENLEKIRSFGVTIAMDDFGTGYSSLDQLRRLPIDMLKIDRSFVARIADRREDLDLVAVIVKLANSLRQSTLAEGVETPAQLACLRDLEVDLAQGYLFAEPLVAAEVTRGWRAM